MVGHGRDRGRVRSNSIWPLTRPATSSWPGWSGSPPKTESRCRCAAVESVSQSAVFGTPRTRRCRASPIDAETPGAAPHLPGARHACLDPGDSAPGNQGRSRGLSAGPRPRLPHPFNAHAVITLRVRGQEYRVLHSSRPGDRWGQHPSRAPGSSSRRLTPSLV